ncbi:hypothetical protein [Methanosarcina horonobensis]|nr:hypothetical protein [Methanosarcina horonobensis]
MLTLTALRSLVSLTDFQEVKTLIGKLIMRQDIRLTMTIPELLHVFSR